MDKNEILKEFLKDQKRLRKLPNYSELLFEYLIIFGLFYLLIIDQDVRNAQRFPLFITVQCLTILGLIHFRSFKNRSDNISDYQDLKRMIGRSLIRRLAIFAVFVPILCTVHYCFLGEQELTLRVIAQYAVLGFLEQYLKRFRGFYVKSILALNQIDENYDLKQERKGRFRKQNKLFAGLKRLLEIRRKIRIRSGYDLYPVYVKDIAYIESRGRERLFFLKKPVKLKETGESSFILESNAYLNWEEVRKLIGALPFVQIHESFIINRNHIDSISDSAVMISDGSGKSEKINITEKYRSEATLVINME